jgi:hemerythrin-like domain-containing protein
MTRSLLGTAAPGFDRPLDVLEACHDRIARQCDTLEKLLAHVPTHGDEERNLFPLLELAGAPDACDLVETLTLEHDELALLWRQLRPDLQQIEQGMALLLDEGLVRRFIALYRSHLEFENTQVLPLARQLLGSAEMERLGRAMAARRGVPYTG